MTRMEYGPVEALAAQVAAASDTLGGGGGSLSGAADIAIAVPLPFVDDPVFGTSPAFGNTESAADCLSAYHRARGSAGEAVAGLVSVLDTDVERLGQAVAAFRETDHATADRMFAAASQGMNVYSAHVHSDGSGNDDLVRSGHIDRLRESIDGPAVLGADLNAELDDGNMSAASVAAYGDHGFDVNAGEVGGTSHSGRSIDYVMPTGGITAGNAERVDGATSDHDGQRVDLTIPHW